MAGKTNLNGLYKTRYGKKQEAVPEWAVLSQMIKYDPEAGTGKDFREPIFVRRSQGVTFAGGSNLGTAYTLAAPIPLQSEEAVVSGAEIIMREQLAYGAVSAAMKAGERAFGSALDEVVLGLDESHRMYIEVMGLYGQTNIGVIETVTADTATTKVLTISKATWAPGIWAQTEKMLIDAYDTTGVTLINTNAALEFTNNSDPDARKILVTGNATDVGNLVAGQVLVFRASASMTAAPQVCAGLDKIITNVGTLFGISAAGYGLWRGNVLDATGQAPTMSMFHQGAVRACRGGSGDITYLLNTFTFADLADDQAALRRYADKSGGKFENGANEIVYYGAQGGKMTFKPHFCMKLGDAFGVQAKHWVRGGDSDLVDHLDGRGDFFLDVPDKAAYEFRNFSQLFWYCRRPAAQVKIKNLSPRGMA